MQNIQLSNGMEMPPLALGTWLIPDSDAVEAVRQAIKAGYRHIDTAQAYGNERGVGEGIRTSGVPREDIFVTTKVAAEIKSYEEAAASINRSLELLQTGYIDLLLIHCPQPWAEYNKSSYRYEKENQAVWRAMEEALEAGKVRAIGVSNFIESDLESLMTAATIKPMANQFLCHISNTPLALIDYCHSHGIATMAYSPVAHGAALNNPHIAAMAKIYGVSIPQLCIRYCMQLGMVALPKSANPDHIRQNAQVDFIISDEDMERLKRYA
ncbi:MAG: aldo/keto reductase [Paludibacteraceae bacterium]|nr:aldo/keto reductase [Paludibacteraceae bacterium]